MYGQNEATGTLDHWGTWNSGVPFRPPAAGESAPSSLHLAALWGPLCASLAHGIRALATWGAPREKEGKHAGRRGGAYTSRLLGRFLPHLGNSRVTAPRPPLCYSSSTLTSLLKVKPHWQLDNKGGVASLLLSLLYIHFQALIPHFVILCLRRHTPPF